MTAISMEQKTLPPTTIIQEAPKRREGSVSSQVLSLFLGIVVVLLVASTIFQVLLYSRQNEMKERTGKTAVSSASKGPIVNDFTFNVGRRGGRRKFREHIEINDREEDVSTDEARMILDYANGFFVAKLAGGEVCYVSKFDPKMSIDEVRGNLSNTQLDEAEVDDTDDMEEIYKSTNETVNPMFLSKKAREMCANSKILVAEQVGDLETRSKRSTSVYCNSAKFACCFPIYTYPCRVCNKTYRVCFYRVCTRDYCFPTNNNKATSDCKGCPSVFKGK